MNSVVLMNGLAARRYLPLQHPHHNRAQQEAHALSHQPRPYVNGNLRPPHRRLPCTVVSHLLLIFARMIGSPMPKHLAVAVLQICQKSRRLRDPTM